ncbi:ABC transporter substrate-binding protein [Streptosporangium sp. CA-115845]|uniref:ABC transporter substrate-binding protein n=1 Tax=Streptosporangium sp. CA-115845 TaxID=3240071 RepID=UPI003D8B59DC
MSTRRLRSTAAALVAVGLSTSACGSDTPSSSAEDSIKILTIASFESQQFSVPQVRTAVEVAVKQINDAGGIDGRKIEASFCNDKFDPNEAASCAREAVSEGAVAVVGGTTPNAGAILPILEEAGVAWLAGSGTSGPIELTSPVSYPINAGAPGMTIGAGAKAVALGGKNVVIMAGENENAQINSEQSARGVKAAGGTSTMITVPLNAADYAASAAAALARKPDGISIGSTPEDTAKIVQALRQTGYSGVITGPSSLFPPSSLQALGASATGITVLSRLAPTTSTDIPEIKEFVDQMTAADPQVRIEDLGLNAWTGVRLFGKLLQGRTVDGPKSVIDALADIKTPIELGTVPAYPGVQNPPPVPDFPRVAVFKTMESKVVDGKLVQQGDFFDPLAANG